VLRKSGANSITDYIVDLCFYLVFLEIREQRKKMKNLNNLKIEGKIKKK
jgi:hypothetical protein